MRIYVKCDRCQKEGVPKRSYNTNPRNEGSDYFGQIHTVRYVTENDQPPDGWSQATLLSATYLLCGECATAIEGIVRGAIMPVPK